MKRMREKKGVLTIEASISYSIFLMVIVTMLYIIRIVYTYGLVQHAVSQTAKELSAYTYIYQVTGLNDIYQSIGDSVSGRTEQFNQDADSVVKLYEAFSSGNYQGETYEGTTNPKDIMKNIGSALVGNAAADANSALFGLVVKPLMSGYIGADSKGNSADDRLQALRVVGGIDGLDFSSSSFFDDGVTVDLVVCYTIDPILPIDIMPTMNLMNRACVRGMSGSSVFERKSSEKKEETTDSVWDMDSATARGKAIQEKEHVRNLPDNFPVYSAYDASSRTATAEMSIDLRSASYQKTQGIKNVLNTQCNQIMNYKKASRNGVTLDSADIGKSVLIVYVPSSTKDREIDDSTYRQALSDVKERYPDIKIVTKEID